MNRFTPNGIYFELAVNDYAVVDFRGNAVNLPVLKCFQSASRALKRISVIIHAVDDTDARCLNGHDATVVKIKLADQT